MNEEDFEHEEEFCEVCHAESIMFLKVDGEYFNLCDECFTNEFF